MNVVAQAQAMLAKTSGLEELHCAQAVLLQRCWAPLWNKPQRFSGFPARVCHDCRRGCGSDARSREQRGAGADGGERGVSLEDERRFLAPWAEASKAGGVLVIAPIRAALA